MEPLYKLGDVVTIKKLSLDDMDNYRYSLNYDMVRLAGKTFEIIDISSARFPEAKIPDDGFKYHLKGSTWSWVSSMFEESSTKKSKTKISVHKKKKLEFNFSL